jgi:transposase-like protein
MQEPRPPARAGQPPTARKRLAPSEKYQLFVDVLTGQATQREAAEKYGVDRSTVAGICRTAKQRAGRGPTGPAQQEHRNGRAGCRPGRDRQAAGHQHRAGRDAPPSAGKAPWD